MEFFLKKHFPAVFPVSLIVFYLFELTSLIAECFIPAHQLAIQCVN